MARCQPEKPESPEDIFFYLFVFKCVFGQSQASIVKYTEEIMSSNDGREKHYLKKCLVLFIKERDVFNVTEFKG